MKEEKLTIASHILLYLLAAEDALTPLFNPYIAKKRALYGSRPTYLNTLYRLKKRGWIKVQGDKEQKSISLTDSGQIEALLIKARLPAPKKWDGKWRLIMYDIPEDHKGLRHYLRALLKKNSFSRVQGSVYISPYPMNRAAIEYLKKTKLIEYIRIMKVEEIDDDSEFITKFNLHHFVTAVTK